MYLLNMYKFNGEIVSKRTIVFIGIFALIDSLIPVICETDFITNSGVAIPLLLLSFPASGFYGLAGFCFTGSLIAKISVVFISFIVIWLIFLTLWTNRMYRIRQKKISNGG